MGNPRGRPKKTEASEHCPVCGEVLVKKGFIWDKNGEIQRYQCQTCGFVTVHPLDKKILQKIDTQLKDKVI